MLPATRSGLRGPCGRRRAPNAAMYTFAQFALQLTSPSRVVLSARIFADMWGNGMDELPLILVIEDEYPIQGIVEDALIEAGFAADVLSSGEEALTLFRGGLKNYKALVTDVALKGRLNGREVAAQIRERRPGISRRLYERRARG